MNKRVASFASIGFRNELNAKYENMPISVKRSIEIIFNNENTLVIVIPVKMNMNAPTMKAPGLLLR